jgi:hypothetical protein
LLVAERVVVEIILEAEAEADIENPKMQLFLVQDLH